MLKKELLFALACMGAVACGKEKIVEKIVEVEKPAPGNITITSPKPSDEFAHGDTVRIKALITGVNTLHGYEFSIRDEDHHDNIIYRKSYHLHDKVINVDTFWVNTAHAAGALSLNVVTNLDHDGNSIGKKVSFGVK